MGLYVLGRIEMAEEEEIQCEDVWYGWDLTVGLANLNPATGSAYDLILDTSVPKNITYRRNILPMANECIGRTAAMRIRAALPITPFDEVETYAEGTGFEGHWNLTYTGHLELPFAGGLIVHHAANYLIFEQGIPPLSIHDWGNIARSVNSGVGFTPDLDDSDTLTGFPQVPNIPITNGLLVVVHTTIIGSFEAHFNVQDASGSSSAVPEDMIMSAGVFSGILSPAEVAAHGI